jgi:NAD(P)-dependent dehydrogenase (short-subunit alcohol dehydrogenase family)
MAREGSGVIVNMSPINGLSGMAGSPHYSAAKGGTIAFTQSLAREVAPQGFLANALAPGFVETALRNHLQEPTRLQQVAATPLGRIDTADEIAQSTVFLASEASSFVIGPTLSPNGGNLMV